MNSFLWTVFKPAVEIVLVIYMHYAIFFEYKVHHRAQSHKME